MKRNAFYQKVVGLVAILCLLSAATFAQTTVELTIRRLADQKLHVYARALSGGSTTLLGGSQITIKTPLGSLATTAGGTTAVTGPWAYQTQVTDGTNNYLAFATPSNLAVTLPLNTEVELFNFSTTGTANSGTIMINEVEDQIVQSNQVGTALLFLDNNAGTVNGVVNFYNNAVSTQPFAVANTTVALNANSGAASTGNVGTSAGVTGGSGTYTYTAVLCSNAATASTTTANGGTVSVASSTGALTYTSATGFSGTDTFCINVCDGATCQLVTYNVNVASTCPTFTLPTLSK